MIYNGAYFETVKDIEQLTGLSREEMWSQGFNLDDMDWGFVTEQEVDSDSEFIRKLNLFYCDVCKVTYNNKFYYTMHHA